MSFLQPVISNTSNKPECKKFIAFADNHGLKIMQQVADSMAKADSEKYSGLVCSYKISMEGELYTYYCSLCEVHNKVGEYNKHLQPLSLHRNTSLHLLNLQKSLGKKSESSIAKGIFEKAEGIYGKGLLVLKDSGCVLCRCCDVEISLFGRGNALQRIEDHIKSGTHKKANKIDIQKIRSITDFTKKR